MTTIDFAKALADAKGATFEALPVGDYDVEVAKAEAVTSSNGKPMIKTTMKVVAGPYERRPIINNFVLSLENPQATAIFFRHMKCFGLTEEFFTSLGARGSLEPVATALTGRRARLSLGHREWNGETRNEVKAVKPYTGAPPVAGPAAPGGGLATPGPTSGPTPPSGPTGPTPPAGPGVSLPSPPPAHEFNSTPTPAPQPTTPAPTPAPQPAAVQPVPQPPTEVPAAPVVVPTSTAAGGPSAAESSAAPSAPPAPTVATSEPTSPVTPTQPAPPNLPF